MQDVWRANWRINIKFQQHFSITLVQHTWKFCSVEEQITIATQQIINGMLLLNEA